MMQIDGCSGDINASDEALARFFGPAQVDQSIRHALQCCWMSLPKERKNADELERQMRRLVDRAIRDFREDCQAFGGSGS